MKDKENPIWGFVAERNVFTLATTSNGQPYCTPCFYAFDSVEKQLIFKSSADTRHIHELMLEPKIAGSILPNKLAIAQVKGIQFTGRATLLRNDRSESRLKQLYYGKYPIAHATEGELWVVTLHHVKLTDNKLGFGKKINWKRPDPT